MAKKKKKKSNKGEDSSVAIAPKKSSNLPRKLKFLCMLCKGDHLLRDCPEIPKVLKAWSNGHPSLPLASGSQIGGTSSTSHDKTHEK